MPRGVSVCTLCGRDEAEGVTLDTPAVGGGATGTVIAPSSEASGAPAPAPAAPESGSRSKPSSAPAGGARSSGTGRKTGGSGESLMAAVLPEGAEIGARYRVISLLGRGGMGSVYRVWDEELNRDVALKLIRPEIAADADVIGRFKREIQLSSTVTHRNVLRVYDLGEADGTRFLTMQYVQGRDLSSLVKETGPLPVPRLLSIFRQICQGLEAAHEQGVVHRDLKPQNIMVDASDNVLITDFGLAKNLGASAMTEMGALLGTPAYMSPEQVRGQTVDRRSDIYSLGVILYEMASGKTPFAGGSIFEVMMRRLSTPPRPIGELNPAVPDYLRKIVDRCLAVETSARYQSVAEILADLDAATFTTNVRYELARRRWMLVTAGAALALAVAVAGVVWLAKRKPAPAAPRPTRSVLIADFENKTGDPVFDGTLETAFNIALEDASFITSYRRDAARKVAEQIQPGVTGLPEPVARLVAGREGVNVVTSGAVSSRGSGYEVSVRAVDAVTGKTIVSAEEDADGKNAVLGAVAKLASKVRGALGDTTPESARLAAAETFTAGSFEAAHEYSLAQDLQWAGKWDEAIRHYERAIELDPNMGRAYAGLAAVENNLGRRSEAEKYYKLALARIDRMSEREKYRTRGGYYILLRKPDSAIQEFTALVKQYPADTAGIANLAAAYYLKRDMTNALKEGRRAIEIYPKNVPQRNNLGFYAMYAGDFETAIREQKTVLELNPNFVMAYVGLGISELGAGKPAEAAATWDRLAALGPAGASTAAMGRADLALFQGRVADAQGLLEAGAKADLEAKNRDAAGRKLVALAETYLLAGRMPAAVEATERGRATSKDEFVGIGSALVFAGAGESRKALAIAEELEKRLESDPLMYAKVIRAAVERKAKKYAEALAQLKDAQGLADSWIVHRELSRTYLEAGSFAQADTELDICLKRKGEATALFLDEVPTYHLFPPLYYDRGLALEGLKSPGAGEAFKTYLGLVTGTGDPRAADAKKRVGGG
jgi:tetratricopeptide (TPR) repeat protein/predicted Ser/Thr protein kinase